MAVKLALDSACAGAVELARSAAERRSGVLEVGAHIGVEPEDTRVVTHYFTCDHPGYPGWRWSVTLARASRARVVTVNEVTLVPGEGALLPPTWVPWSARIGAGDVAPGTILPTPDDDPRLVPGFTADGPADPESPDWVQTRLLVAELGLGRERILSPDGRDEAAQRWHQGEGGPDNEMTQLAPASCATCGYFVRLSGPLGAEFGVCANEYSAADARVVSLDHGCGGHSDVLAADGAGEPRTALWDSVPIDETLFY